MDGKGIPLIDLSSWTNLKGNTDSESTPDKHVVVDRVARACREIGFFAVTNHGVPRQLIENTLHVSREYFDLSLEAKQLDYSNDVAKYPYGYEDSECLGRGKDVDNAGGGGMANVTLNATDENMEKGTSDHKETFSIGPNHDKAQNRRWPASPTAPVNFASVLTSYYEALEGLAQVLLKIVAEAWQLPTSDWFAQRRHFHASALRVLNYPAVHTLGPCNKGSSRLRASAHTDYGVLTILYTGGPGLQVLQPSTDTWMDVPTVEGALIVNLGDLMQRWTNDRWRSTLHRVIVPEDGRATRRQSMAYFCTVDGDCVVDPHDLLNHGPVRVDVRHDGTHSASSTPRDTGDTAKRRYYPPVTAMEHLMSKHLASMLK